MVFIQVINGRKKNYNEGILFGPILGNILKYDVIEINNEDDIDKIQNIIQNISDIFDNLINKEKKNEEMKLNYNHINNKSYNINKPKIYNNQIGFYLKAIDEEYKKLNKKRFSIFYRIIENHILTKAYKLFEEYMNKVLTILNNFENTKSTYDMIITFNDNIINCFNKILLSEDYVLKSMLIYFIAVYKDTLIKMNRRYRKYNNNNVKLYYRSKMNAFIIDDIIKHNGKIVTFNFFLIQSYLILFLINYTRNIMI